MNYRSALQYCLVALLGLAPFGPSTANADEIRFVNGETDAHMRRNPPPPPRRPRPVRPPRRPPRQPVRPIRPAPPPTRPAPPIRPAPPVQERDYFQRNLFLQYHGVNFIDLRAMLGLTSLYDGRDIEYVLVQARGIGRDPAEVSLLIDRYEDDYTMVDRFSSSHFLYPYGNAELGYQVRNLELRLQGDIIIESIAVKLGPRYRGY